MQSPFSLIYISLQQYLQKVLPNLALIACNTRQWEADNRPPLAYPFVLIDFTDFTFQDLANEVQTVNGCIDIVLGFKSMSSASTLSPDAVLQQALSYLDAEWQLQQALQGWQPIDAMGCLSRISTTAIPNKKQLQLRQIRYSIAFTDFSTKRSKQKIRTGINVVS
jgi:hypothetical protein